MKKLIFVLSLGLMIGMVNINNAEAQVHVSVNINVQPAWGPSGYDYAEFYYIPEIDIYYDVINQLFYYHNGRRWRSSRFLPVAYSYYDFYSLYKVVLNGVHHPWKYNRRHRNLYVGYCHNYHQVPIYYMHDHRYQHARNNYHAWVEPRHMPRNNGRPVSREYSTTTPRNGRISSGLRSSGSDNRRESVNNNRNTSSRKEATMNTRSTNNRNNSSAANSRSSENRKSNSAVNTRSGDNTRSNATTRSSSATKEGDTAVRSHNSSTRSNVSRSNSVKKESAMTTERRNSSNNESKSSRSTSEKRTDTSSTRSGRR